MASQRLIESNRANAARSTGPRTPEGKARSRLNALKHGLTAARRTVKGVVMDEDPREFLSFRRAMMREKKPVGPDEEELVRRLAAQAWRLRRAEWVEADFLNRDLGRAHHLAQTELPQEHRKEWHQEPHSIIVGTVLGEAMSGPANSYETLRRYERTIERGYYAARRELERVQAARRAAGNRHLAIGNREEEERHWALGTGHRAEESKAEETRAEEAQAEEAEAAAGEESAGTRLAVSEVEPGIPEMGRGEEAPETHEECQEVRAAEEAQEKEEPTHHPAESTPNGEPDEGRMPISSSAPSASVSSPSATCPVPGASAFPPSAKCQVPTAHVLSCETKPIWSEGVSKWNSILQGELRPRMGAAGAREGVQENGRTEELSEGEKGEKTSPPTRDRLKEIAEGRKWWNRYRAERGLPPLSEDGSAPTYFDVETQTWKTGTRPQAPPPGGT